MQLVFCYNAHFNKGCTELGEKKKFSKDKIPERLLEVWKVSRAGNRWQ